MRIVSLIDDRDVIERILRHLGLWEQGVRVAPARAPPEIAGRVIPPSPIGYGGQAEPWLDDPFPDYDTEPVMAYANASLPVHGKGCPVSAHSVVAPGPPGGSGHAPNPLEGLGRRLNVRKRDSPSHARAIKRSRRP